MHWDAVQKTFRSDEAQSILQAFELGEYIDFEPILVHDKASYFQLGALAMSFKRADLIDQLHGLHKKYAYWGERRIPKTMGEWFEPHEIAHFGNLFEVHFGRHWFGAAECMIEHHRNSELQSLLDFKNPGGAYVIDPLQDDSYLLWYASGKGNQQAFRVLLPVSDLAADDYRCFIAAVYNNHDGIAQDIINHCTAHNTLTNLSAGVELFAHEKFYSHNEREDEKVREMRACIQRGKIAASIEHTGVHHVRKI